MDAKEVDNALEGAELVPALRTTLAHAKELLEQCLTAGIPATLGRDASCASGGCAPQVQLWVRPSDAHRLALLVQEQWVELAEREGTGAVFRPVEVSEDEEPPCPACGTAAPLVAGACSDCGLQLE